jgi:putative oxygen-independent coproporphyrinogen III oxidase
MLQLPPLSLYVHIPWCVRKCPYCDFNSHAQKGDIPAKQYIQCLLEDLETDLPYAQNRRLQSIFIGGGTPSLFNAEEIGQLLSGIKSRIDCVEDIEITMEANPGTVETDSFSAYQQAGVNRISIGVQSFQGEKLLTLGRIHHAEEAINVAKSATKAGLRSFNIDLMHGLPNQTQQDALFDLSTAIELQPPHLSWYQLTIEPNTLFHSKPPQLPIDDVLWDIQQQGHELLTQAGYRQYEISAYAKEGQQCRHNLNYWRFGDYIGIGCGAHGKITQVDAKQVIRTTKIKHPKGYMDNTQDYVHQQYSVDKDELPLEYLMNRCRLLEAIPKSEVELLTGQSFNALEAVLSPLEDKGLVSINTDNWRITSLGFRYLNEVLESFVE